MPRKRIHNPKTGKYYALRRRSSTKGRKGTIKGLWKPPTQQGTWYEASPETAFHFYKDIDQPLDITADSVRDFAEKLKSSDIEAIEFHMERGDFESWVLYLGDKRLAKRFKVIKEANHKGEELRKKLCAAITR